jgi:hypothetical protein
MSTSGKLYAMDRIKKNQARSAAILVACAQRTDMAEAHALLGSMFANGREVFEENPAA